jgi:hypothetical protein
MELYTILAQSGPMTTSKAAQILQDFGVPAAAARQRISRRKEPIRTLHGLPFPKRARFIYLDSQFGTDLYWSALIEAIGDANPAYAAALAGLRARGDIVLRKHFDIISGSPELQKGQLASSVVLKRLLSVQLLETVEIEGMGECIALAQSGDSRTYQARTLRARLLTESVLLDAIRAWAGRMNMTGSESTRIRDDSPDPKYSTFRFDLTGPCYLRPMMRYRAEKIDPGFFVADVFLGRDMDHKMVLPFLRKCTMLSSIKGALPFLPMLIADNFTPDALGACRKKGIITTRPETLFGQDVAKALGDLLQTLTRTALATPSQIENLFKRLSTVEGSAGNLRGALFELIVGHLVRELEGGDLDLGSIVLDFESGKRAEIDVRLIKQKRVMIYECKGYQPSNLVRLPEIEKWVKEKVPTIYRALKREDRFSGSSFVFEFWTCGGFDAESLEYLETVKASTKKYEIGWKSGKDVQDYAQGMASSSLNKILSEHYFQHPIAIFNKAVLADSTSATSLSIKGELVTI